MSKKELSKKKIIKIKKIKKPYRRQLNLLVTQKK